MGAPVVAALLVCPWAARADEAAPVRACAQVESACKDAGYVRGGNPPKGKAMEEDCLRLLLRGAEVPGVKIDSRLVSACGDERALEGKKKPTPGTTPPTVLH